MGFLLLIQSNVLPYIIADYLQTTVISSLLRRSKKQFTSYEEKNNEPYIDESPKQEVAQSNMSIKEVNRILLSLHNTAKMHEEK